MAVSLVQAANNAFATYLAARFTAAGYTGATAVTTGARWPTPSKQLPTRAVTVVTAGPREEVLFDPYVEATTASTSTTVTCRWVVCSVDQPLQLDVWATSDMMRDDLVARLDGFLHQGESVSLSGVTSDPFRQGVLVALGDGWTGNADFLFDGADYLDDRSSTKETMYRAVYRGRASMLLTMSATSARIATLRIRERLREQDPAAGNYTVVSLTSAGSTITESA